MNTPTRVTRAAPRRRGFTLIELVVVVAIIGILATILIGVAATAGTTARSARTKSMITRLHTLLIERYDGYRTRRVELGAPLRVDSPATRQTLVDFAGIDAALLPGISPTDPRVVAAARVAGLRELMKLEMPDRWSDVYGGELPDTLIDINLSSPVPAPNRFLADRPSLWLLYAREYNRINDLTNSLTGVTNTTADLNENQGAELLYMTVINATGDGEARTLFREEDVGDTDGDGAFEFLDGWGRPISVVRWPAGFESDMQLDAPRLAALAASGQPGIDDATAEILEDHDPYDLFRVDNGDLNVDPIVLRGWRQTPLIVSSGRDEEFGLVLDAEPTRPVDPYAQVPNGQWLGSFGDDPDLASDNLHNHALSNLSQTR